MTMQPLAQKKFVIGSSRRPRTARTVLLRMAADQERADRIRALKKDHLEYTWQAIADHVGVSLRAAQAWQEKGGIDYEHAKALAELWGEELDYIMRGAREETSDLTARELAGLDHLDARVERVERSVIDVRDEFRKNVKRIEDLLEKQDRNLAVQTKLLEEIKDLAATFPSDETTQRLLRALGGAG